MRRKWVLGVGLATLVGGSAAAQPTPAEPAPPSPPISPTSPMSPTSPVTPGTPGYVPLYSSPTSPSSRSSGSAYVAPTEGFSPANNSTQTLPSITAGIRPLASFAAVPIDAEVPTALPKDHPWTLKPEHGPWFILVKSYVRPAADSRSAQMQDDKGWTALQLGEGLAKEIRETFRVQAFLFEYISEERKAEHRTIMAARQKATSEYLSQLAKIEEKAQLQGMDFMRPDNKFRVLKHDARDQIGVLVGGFQSEADAIKALAKLKTWPAPKTEMLMDGSAIVQKGQDGKPVIEQTRLNPYASAFVVANPSVARETPNFAKELDPFIVKLNEDNPYSLLKATKGWTLAVRSFGTSVMLTNEKEKPSSPGLMRKFGFGRGGVLSNCGDQAEMLAEAIRQMREPSTVSGQPGRPLNLEAFVLHTRHSSLVTVGQFDGPDDPALQATKQLLSSIKLNVAAKPGTAVDKAPEYLFNKLTPMPVPKP